MHREEERITTNIKYHYVQRNPITQTTSTLHTTPLAALASLVRLRVDTGCHENVVTGRGLDGVSRLLKRLAGDDPVDI